MNILGQVSQNSKFEKNHVAIVGAGAAGCICAYHLLKTGFDVTLFDKGTPLRTLLPTGGGRCNLAHAEYDFKELANNYPRGEKFLYSVFSRFSTSDTIEMFENMGIETYTQEDGRIFPVSNSAKDVREKILQSIRKSSVKIIKEEVTGIEREEGEFFIKTATSPQPSPVRRGSEDYVFSHVVIAIGGHSGYELAKDAGLKIIPPRPSLVGLNTKEDFKELSGTIVNDILFTHFGISGPKVYTISSLKAFDDFPYELSFDLCPKLTDLQNVLNIYPHKEIKNILSKYMPEKVVKYLLKDLDETAKAHTINGATRDLILDKIHNFKVTVIGTNKGEETVTAGGVDLNEIDSKTMEAKQVPNLYCIGEVLNIDGFCGGFNLQNAWSTAYIAAQAILQEE